MFDEKGKNAEKILNLGQIQGKVNAEIGTPNKGVTITACLQPNKWAHLKKNNTAF